MKRRYFLGSLGTYLLLTKNWFSGGRPSQIETPTPNVNLQPGDIFELPIEPQDNQKITFFSTQEWNNNPAVVKRNGNFIMGYDLDLSLDTPRDFSLTYDKRNRNWIIS